MRIIEEIFEDDLPEDLEEKSFFEIVLNADNAEIFTERFLKLLRVRLWDNWFDEYWRISHNPDYISFKQELDEISERNMRNFREDVFNHRLWEELHERAFIIEQELERLAETESKLYTMLKELDAIIEEE